jgi:hypothetical protein
MSTQDPTGTTVAHATPLRAGGFALHVLAKRTWTFAPGAALVPAAQQAPIAGPAYYDDAAEVPRADHDLFACQRAGTDLVVQGSAHSLRGPVGRMEVSVAVMGAEEAAAAEARVVVRLEVIGDRRVHDRGAGNPVAFSEPEPFTSMPVRFDRAYGGRDRWAERARPDDAAIWLAKHLGVPEAELSKYVYLRNPAGRGYVVHRDPAAIAELQLPNLEWPQDRLTPERLFTGASGAWPRAPLPAAFDWLDASWFPRLTWLGTPIIHALAPAEFPEVESGLVAPEQVAVDAAPFPVGKLDPRFFRGAVPRLALDALTGRETIVVTGMHPTERRVQVRLPAGPQVVLEPPGGKPHELEPALRTVVVRPETNELETLWVGSLPVARPPTQTELGKLRYAVSWQG